MQHQGKKQGWSTGKRLSHLCHRVLLLCTGHSGCSGLLGRGQLQQNGAGSKRKAPCQSWDMLMGAMSFRKGERGKQQMKKRQVGSDSAISSQFPCGRVPSMWFVLFVCCPTCVSIPAARERSGMKVGCVCVRNSTRKELIQQQSRGSGISYLLTLLCPVAHLLCQKQERSMPIYARVCIHIHTVKAMLVGDSQEECNPHVTKWKVAALPSLLVDPFLHQPVTLPLQALEHCSNLPALI